MVSALTLAAGLLRRYHLGAKSIWIDEGVLWYVTQGSFAEILTRHHITQTPLLYPVLLWLAQMFGDGELILRGIAWIAGTLSVPLAYLLFRKFMSHGAAFAVAVLVTIQSTQILYAQQVREYSLAFLLATAMILTTWDFIQKPGCRGAVLIALVWSAGVWTQYGLALLAVSLNLIFVARWIGQRSRRTLLQWAAGQLPVLASAVLVFLLSFRFQYTPGGNGLIYLADAYWDPASRSLLEFISAQTAEIVRFTYSDPYFFPAVLIVGLLGLLLERGRRQALLWIAVPFGVAVALGLLRVYPYLGARHSIYLTPLVFLLFGLGLDYLLRIDPKKIVPLVLLGLLLVPGVQATVEYYRWPGYENIRPVMKELRDQFQPGDRIYVYYSSLWAFEYYSRNQDYTWISGKNHRSNPELYLPEIEQIARQPGRIWWVFSHCHQTECEDIRTYVQKSRPLELIRAEHEAWLYLTP